jgi:phospholipase D1/2
LHCYIDGPAAYDILTNFEERWLEEGSKLHGLRKLLASSSECKIFQHHRDGPAAYDDFLVKIEKIPDIIGMADFPCQSQNDPEGWHVQVQWISILYWSWIVQFLIFLCFLFFGI